MHSFHLAIAFQCPKYQCEYGERHSSTAEQNIDGGKTGEKSEARAHLLGQ